MLRQPRKRRLAVSRARDRHRDNAQPRSAARSPSTAATNGGDDAAITNQNWLATTRQGSVPSDLIIITQRTLPALRRRRASSPSAIAGITPNVGSGTVAVVMPVMLAVAFPERVRVM